MDVACKIFDKMLEGMPLKRNVLDIHADVESETTQMSCVSECLELISSHGKPRFSGYVKYRCVKKTLETVKQI